jgi:hypothetical protein
MLSKDQIQDVGAGGVAIQAAGNVTIGTSAAEVRQIALDMARLTFFELSGTARETLSARVEEITDKVISKLEREYPEGLRKAIDPDFQYAFLTVQKQYGRTGDKDLGELLVELLVDRSKHDQRDILQIVLNESMEVAPKLTASQLSVLALIFLFRYSKDNGLSSNEKLGEYFDAYISPFVDLLVKNSATYQHLEFAGCGSIGPKGRGLDHALVFYYPGLFSKGFELREAESVLHILGKDFLMVCINDSSKLQIKCLDDEQLKGIIDHTGVEGEQRALINSLYSKNRMDAQEVRKKCVALRPYMETVFSCWDDSDMGGFTLTSVGMAIGHANIKKAIGREFADLSIWIN